jgi:hypothetical protein
LYIGDSYTLGKGSVEMSYACMAARKLEWLCHLSALPGTGYISGGPANRFVIDQYLGVSSSFIERIPHLGTVYDPGVVIFDGGRNDLIAPVEDVFDAMVATLDEATRVWPNAPVVVIRPRFLDRPGDDLGFSDAFFDRVKDAVPRVIVIDPLATFDDTDTSTMLGKDEIHPNRRGELAITSALTRSLASLHLAMPT